MGDEKTLRGAQSPHMEYFTHAVTVLLTVTKRDIKLLS